jgi:hypothetical protein
VLFLDLLANIVRDSGEVGRTSPPDEFGSGQATGRAGGGDVGFGQGGVGKVGVLGEVLGFGFDYTGD